MAKVATAPPADAATSTLLQQVLERQVNRLLKGDQDLYLEMHNEQRSKLGLRPLEYVLERQERTGILDLSTGAREPMNANLARLVYKWVHGGEKKKASIRAIAEASAEQARAQVIAQTKNGSSQMTLHNTGTDPSPRDVRATVRAIRAGPGNNDTKTEEMSDHVVTTGKTNEKVMRILRGRQRRKEAKQIQKTKDNTGWDEIEAGSDDVDEDEMEDSRP